MKLHWSPRSPFVRKVMIVAHELGLTDRIDCVRTVVATTRPHVPLMEENPLSKSLRSCSTTAPCSTISPVICEYLDSLHSGRKLVPRDGKERMTALRRQALGDGFLDFLLLLRNERERTHPSPVHVATFGTKKLAVLKALDKEAGDLATSPFTVGHIAIGCALSYLDFRFGDEDWRGRSPRYRALA